MRLSWRPLDRRKAPLGTIYGAVLGGCAVLASMWIWMDLPRLACPLRRMIGVPCPTCGSTRLVEALLRGDLRAALASNPLVFTVLVGVGVWALGSTLTRVLGLPSPHIDWQGRDLLWVRAAMILVVLSGWAYVVVKP
jgi:hypothetical protein